jgi:LacI family transcriptional regulator
MATIEQIAKRANVSTSTVSRILHAPGNHKSYTYSEATRKKILGLARELEYRPNMMARSLKGKKSFTIGFLASTLISPLAQIELEELDGLLTRNGYRLVIGCTRNREELEEAHIQEFLARRVDGIILGYFETPKLNERIKKLIGMDLPVVGIGCLSDSGMSYVDLDRAEGTFQLMRHLIVEHGHREIAFLSGAYPAGRSIAAREAGYRRALVESGIEVREELIFQDTIVQRQSDWFERAKGQLQECKGRLGRVPRAIFASNDLKALAVVRELVHQGYRVPEDVAVVGFDGIDVGGQIPLGLTTVRQPRERIAEEAVRLLLEMIEGGKPQEAVPVIIQPELIVRESCGCRRVS